MQIVFEYEGNVIHTEKLAGGTIAYLSTLTDSIAEENNIYPRSEVTIRFTEGD